MRDFHFFNFGWTGQDKFADKWEARLWMCWSFMPIFFFSFLNTVNWIVVALKFPLSSLFSVVICYFFGLALFWTVLFCRFKVTQVTVTQFLWMCLKALNYVSKQFFSAKHHDFVTSVNFQEEQLYLLWLILKTPLEK